MIVKIIGVLIIVVLAGYAGISIYIANKLTKPIPTPLTTSPTEISLNYENVEFTTSDGFHLKGWLFKGNSGKVIIPVAGSNQNRTNPDYKTVEITRDLLSLGYNVLLFDRRTTGESDSGRLSLGQHEGQDVLAAVEYIKSKGFKEEKIGIIGNSIGAIATFMVIDELRGVGAFVSDSAAAQVKPVVEHLLETENNVPFFLFPGVFFAGKVFFGIDVDAIRPIDKVRLIPERKILFLHGAKDNIIDINNSRQLHAESNPESKLVIFGNSRHVQTYKTNPELYKKEVFGFLDNQLGQ